MADTREKKRRIAGVRAVQPAAKVRWMAQDGLRFRSITPSPATFVQAIKTAEPQDSLLLMKIKIERLVDGTGTEEGLLAREVAG